jgi:pimeloyl-ACP methyl ester carboxylesterase
MRYFHILNVIRFNELDQVTLVGHSFGGMPVTGAADRAPEKVSSLVYLDALVPVPPDVRWRFTPHPIGSFVEPIRLTGSFESIGKKTYVRATGLGPDFSSIVADLTERHGWQTMEIEAGHNMMIDAPMQTAVLLEQLA